MIEATYRALAPQQVVERLEIKTKELEVHQMNLSAVNGTAAFIGGFAFTGITSIAFNPEDNTEIKIFFYLFSVLCIACSMYSVVVSTAITVLAPDMSIRGANPEVNIQRALEGVRASRNHVYFSYALSIVLFQFTLVGVAVYTLDNRLYLNIDTAVNGASESVRSSARTWRKDVRRALRAARPLQDLVLEAPEDAGNSTGGGDDISDFDRIIYICGGIACFLLLMGSLISSAVVGLRMRRRFGKDGDLLYGGKNLQSPAARAQSPALLNPTLT